MRIIKEIRLENFRCHGSYGKKFREGVTEILGENGCGKTSVLEAIYIAMRGKSFRAVDKEIQKRNSLFYRVEMFRENGEKILVKYDGQARRKKFQIKDRETARLPKEEKYPVVLFLPEDLHLIVSSPARKRKFFDEMISQRLDGFSGLVSRYEKTLRQRNELLKSEGFRREEIFSWDMMLAKYGVEIRKERMGMVREINSLLTETYRGISENADEVWVEYESFTAESGVEEYLRCLELDFQRDLLTGHTNFGVHRDDFNFIFNGEVADGNASRGEMRSIVIAMKFIEAGMLKEPVILLDDVFSELDASRQKALVENFRENQVVLTSTERNI